MPKSKSKSNIFEAHYLGTMEYSDAVDTMMTMRDLRVEGKIGNRLLFLEHPSTITAGRRDSDSDLRVDKSELTDKGISFVHTDRGGKLTYHGPGQLVVYFIVDINKLNLKVDRLVWLAEEGMRILLQEYGIETSRDDDNPGLWIDTSKIASLGFHLHKGVSSHGVSLNINCDLVPFTYLVPCGLKNRGVTSIYQETGENYHIIEVAKELAHIYGRLFEKEIKYVNFPGKD